MKFQFWTPYENEISYIKKILVGISATMCHSAEKIPAKEGCQYKRVST